MEPSWSGAAAAQAQSGQAQQAQSSRSRFRNLGQGKVIEGRTAKIAGTVPLKRESKRPVFPHHDVLHRGIKALVGGRIGAVCGIPGSQNAGTVARRRGKLVPITAGVCAKVCPFKAISMEEEGVE